MNIEQDVYHSDWAYQAKADAQGAKDAQEEFWSPFENTSEYYVQRADDRILSVREDFYEYCGGVHGMYGTIGHVFDTQTGERMSLSDVISDTDAIPMILAEKLVEKYPGDIYNPADVLAETLAEYDNVTVIHNDILKVDIAALAQEKNNGRPIKVVANLPYYITTPIIMGLFESNVPIDSITIMVQKEVADRMQVGPGTKDYGALSLAVQYYAKPEIVANVPPNCFMPRPNVGSAVIRLTKYEEPPVFVENEEFMFSLIRATFNQRRKTLVNAIGNAPNLNISKEMVTEVLSEMGESATVRGETFTLEKFAEFSNLIQKKMR